MKRHRAMIVLLASVFPAFLLAAATAGMAGEPASSPPRKIVMIDGIRKGQAAVPFSHRAHKTLTCWMCHHADERGEGQRCSGCHAEKADGEVPGLKDAFHRKCMGCHKKAKRGPLICTRCHKPDGR